VQAPVTESQESSVQSFESSQVATAASAHSPARHDSTPLQGSSSGHGVPSAAGTHAPEASQMPQAEQAVPASSDTQVPSPGQMRQLPVPPPESYNSAVAK